MYKAEQDRRLIQFLMGLNELYTTIRGNILMITPLPTLGQAFALLIQEEKQRELRPLNHSFGQSSSMHVSVGGESSTGRNFRTNYNITNHNGGERTKPFCDHCK